MGMPQPIKRYTPREYYALERAAEYRSEYYKGEIFAIAGSSTRHSRITANLIAALHPRLSKHANCIEYESNQRLKIMTTGLRCYPDVSIYCGPLEYDQEDDQSHTAVNPTVLFEVLSPSTEKYDRGVKSLNFRQIASLQAYVLVSQEIAHIEVYARQPNNTWLLSEAMKIDASIEVPGTRITLPLAEVYDRVEFPPLTAIE